jgi:tetratricopeptide (TPR) repeat protein
MPRKARRTDLPLRVPAQPRINFAGYLLTAILAALLGSGVTYLVLRSKLESHAVASAPPLPADADRVLSYWYEDQKQWPQAIALMTRAIAGGQDNPNNRTDLGVDYFQSGQLQNALAQYQIAQREDPQHENSLFNEGSVYAQMGQMPQALAAWRLYLQRFPKGGHVTAARALIAQIQTHPTLPPTPSTSS